MAADELVTATMERDTILAVLAELIPSLAAAWGPQLTGEHGAVSNIAVQDQWQAQEVAVGTLIDHLVGEESRVDFRVSEWDYWLHDTSGVETIKLCHESDLHFELSEGPLRARVLEILAARGIHHYTRRAGRS
jgi:hypothetical protein